MISNTRFILFFIILGATQSFAQKKINTINVTDEITFATVDRVGELYVVTTSGQIQKFDTQGKLLYVYKKIPLPTLFDPRDGARLFAYYRKDRRVEFLSPSFEVSTNYLIDSAFVIEPWLVCSSGDYNLWILDTADRTLKKINPRTSTMEVDVKFPEHLPTDFRMIISLREYQGFLFLLEEQKGIHIFNGMGKWIKTIAGANLTYFNFLGEELYYPASGKLAFLNLFSTEKREMRLGKPFKFALITDERLFGIQGNTIDFFEFKP